ncbi:MAG TPA: hypothetical protein VFD41_09160 [Actinomycetales bacterium]|nr:hypothetical protein [Actinomycetales bacterium]
MSDPSALPSFPPPPEEHPLRGRVLDVLIDAQMAPDLDGDGDVAVAVEGQKMFVRCVDGDMPLMRLFGQWRIGPTVPDDELARLRAASAITARLNLVKVTLHDAVLLVAIDVIISRDTDLRQVLLSGFPALMGAVQMWHKQAGGRVAGDDDGPSPSD